VLPPTGLAVELSSTLPLGCGMGSSAALAVALVRALARLNGREAAFEEIHARAFAVERAFHGNPSGIDHAVSALGGVVAYRRAPEGPQLQALALPSPLQLVVVDSGAPGDTAEMVARVRARAEEPLVAEALTSIGAHVEMCLPALLNGDLHALGRALSVNHAWLQRLGVSTPRLDVACALLEGNGALGAKLAGAGGGGVCFGLLPGPAAIAPCVDALALAGFRAFPLQVGAPPR
jgi:mevalonate kinase